LEFIDKNTILLDCSIDKMLTLEPTTNSFVFVNITNIENPKIIL